VSELAAPAPAVDLGEPAPARGRSPDGETPLRRLAADFAGSRLAVASLTLLLLIVAAALLAPLIASQNPYDLNQIDIMDSQLPPGSPAAAGGSYPLGTDAQGRDMLSAILYGLRISLLVSVASTALAFAIGVTLGVSAGYFGGRLDAFLMRVVDIQLSFPAILIALVLLAVIGRGVDKVILALVIVQWAHYARTVRGSALVERQKEYVEAARGLALGHRRILLRHVLPNCLAPVVVVGTVQVAHAITLEATLSFLGVGVPVTEPSLGQLVANGFEFMLSGEYWISFFPGLALLVAVANINLVADRLRRVLNPRLER
jgi:peptide/nickel transport system permease protein